MTAPIEIPIPILTLELADHFRQNVNECHERAQIASNQKSKTIWLKMALYWRGRERIAGGSFPIARQPTERRPYFSRMFAARDDNKPDALARSTVPESDAGAR
jgi:hypothetical protein